MTKTGLGKLRGALSVTDRCSDCAVAVPKAKVSIATVQWRGLLLPILTMKYLAGPEFAQLEWRQILTQGSFKSTKFAELCKRTLSRLNPPFMPAVKQRIDGASSA